MDGINFFHNKRILVTGGHGYLGTHLVNTLRTIGCDVHIMTMQKTTAPKTHCVDIRDRSKLKSIVESIQPEIIYHLAASLDRNRGFNNIDQIQDVNYNGTLHLLLALQDIDYRNLIFTSTSEVYGDNLPPFHETQMPRPVSPYSLTKICAEQLIQTFSTCYGKKYTLLRLFNFYGPNMSSQFFIPQAVNTLKKDNDFDMTFGAQQRDFLYVDDIIQALLLSAFKEEALNEIFNVCSGASVSLKRLITEIKIQLNSQGKINLGAIPYRINEIWDMVGSNEKIRKRLGFNQMYNLSQGVEKLLSE